MAAEIHQRQMSTELHDTALAEGRADRPSGGPVRQRRKVATGSDGLSHSHVRVDIERSGGWFGNACGSVSCACPGPGASENGDPVAAGVVADGVECERLAAIADRVCPGPYGVGVLAETALVVLRV